MYLRCRLVWLTVCPLRAPSVGTSGADGLEFAKVYHAVAILIRLANEALAVRERHVDAQSNAQCAFELSRVKRAITRRVEPGNMN